MSYEKKPEGKRERERLRDGGSDEKKPKGAEQVHWELSRKDSQ